MVFENNKKMIYPQEQIKYQQIKKMENEKEQYDSCWNKMLYFFSDKWGQLILCLLHSISSIIMFYQGADDPKSGILDVFIIKTNSSSITERFYLDKVGNINLFYLNGTFLLFTGVSHFVYFISRYYFNYAISIKLRYIEYAVSASIMIVIIASLSGCREVMTLLCISGLTGTTMSFGMFNDMAYETNTHHNYYIPVFWEGFYPYIFTWITVFVYFFMAVSESENVPKFVYAIVIVLFIFYSSFAVAQWWFTAYPSKVDTEIYETRRLLFGERENTTGRKIDLVDVRNLEIARKLQREKTLERQDGALHLLSFVAKYTLSWLCFGGILNANDNEIPN